MKRARSFYFSCLSILLLSLSVTGQDYGCPHSPCPQPNGMFPVPNDCSSFYNCAHCVANQQQCAPGTVFDPIGHLCNHVYLVNCSASASNSQHVNEHVNERKHGGQVRHGLSQSSSQSGDALGARSSFNQYSTPPRYGSQSDYVSHSAASNPSLGQEYGHFVSRQAQVPSTSIYQSGGQAYPTASTSIHRSGEQAYPTASTSIHQSGRQAYPRASANSADYIKQDQRGSRLVEGQHDDHHRHHHHHDQQWQQQQQQNSQKQQQANSTGNDSQAVAVSRVSRFNHSHVSHHPEAVSYLQTHQVVYDHPHAEHHEHLDYPQPSDVAGGVFSPNNRGSEQAPEIRRPQTSAEPTATQSSAPAQPSFDLKGRQLSNSGFVPSYVAEQMRDDLSAKPANYGERTFVRSASQDYPESGIRNFRGEPVNPDRFYTDDVSPSDVDSQDSPAQLSADDLRHFQLNQAAQGDITYIQTSSNIDRQARSSAAPFFRKGQPQSTSSSSFLSDAIDPAQSRRLDTTNSGQLFTEHRRLKAPQSGGVDSQFSGHANTQARSDTNRNPGSVEQAESRQHIVYVSAPALPTPLPLVADQWRKVYHHMGYRFDHDPLQDKDVKSA